VLTVSIIIVVDGVMRKTKDQSPILEGVALYKSLNENYRVLLVATHRERTDIWMKTNNLAKKIDDIVEIEHDEFRQIDSLRSRGKIDFVVTDNTDLTKRLLEVGIPVLAFLNPRYVRPEFRPDGRAGVRSWDSITEELDKQQGLYEEDQRLSDPEAMVFGVEE